MYRWGRNRYCRSIFCLMSLYQSIKLRSLKESVAGHNGQIQRIMTIATIHSSRLSGVSGPDEAGET